MNWILKGQRKVFTNLVIRHVCRTGRGALPLRVLRPVSVHHFSPSETATKQVTLDLKMQTLWL